MYWNIVSTKWYHWCYCVYMYCHGLDPRHDILTMNVNNESNAITIRTQFPEQRTALTSVMC